VESLLTYYLLDMLSITYYNNKFNDDDDADDADDDDDDGGGGGGGGDGDDVHPSSPYYSVFRPDTHFTVPRRVVG